MTVRKKLFITVFILSALAAVIGVMGLLNLKKFNENVGELAVAVHRVDAAQSQRVEFQSFSGMLENYLRVHDQVGAKALSNKLTALREDVDGLKNATECPKCTSALKKTVSELSELELRVAVLIMAVDNGDEGEEREQRNKINAQLNETSSSLAMSAKMTRELANTIFEESKAAYRIYVLYTIIASLLVIVVGLMLGYFMTKGITLSTRELYDAAMDFTKGDRGRRVKTRLTGEFSALASSFNRMARQIQDSETRLREWGEKLEQQVDEQTDELRIANKEISQRIDETGAYLEIARIFAGTLDLEKTLNRTAQTLSKLLKSDYALISLVDEESLVRCWEMEQCDEEQCPAHETESLECWTVSNTHCRKEFQGTFDEKIAECLKCRVFKNISVKIVALSGIREPNLLGSSVHSSNTACGRAILSLRSVTSCVDQDDRSDIDLYRIVKDCVAQVSIPLVTKNRVLGTMAFGFKSKQSFGEHELGLMTSLSEQLALGIENAILYKKKIQTANEAQLLYKAGEAMGATIDKSDISSKLIEYALDALQSDSGIVLLLDDENQELEVTARKNFNKIMLNAFGKTPDSGVVGAVFSQGKPLLIDKRIPCSRLHDELSGIPFRSAMFSPLQYNGTVFGVVGTLSLREKNFTYSDLRLFTTLCNLAGAAINNARLFDKLGGFYIDSVKALVEALEAKDSYTRGHSENVAYLAVAIAQKLGLNTQEIEELKTSALLHDIGKIGIRDQVLNKQGKLDHDEFEYVQEHPRIAYQILGRIPAFKDIAEIILHHHERYDGTGYASGLAGEDIPLGSRVLAVADTFDSITSNRPYRMAESIDFAKTELLKNSGTQFDPAIVEIFVEILDSGYIEPQSEESDVCPSRNINDLD
jgi:HD-GYP domain-containing protein (c-di-GMP phosphodiesterase class II)/methyl-accepting chemotaxis protein